MQIRRPQDLGAVIKAVRRSRGINQAELAKLLGVTRVWIGQIERGKASPSLDLVLRTLKELQITLTVNTGDTPDSPPNEGDDVATESDASGDRGLNPTPTPAVVPKSRQPKGPKTGASSRPRQ